MAASTKKQSKTKKTKHEKQSKRKQIIAALWYISCFWLFVQCFSCFCNLMRRRTTTTSKTYWPATADAGKNYYSAWMFPFKRKSCAHVHSECFICKRFVAFCLFSTIHNKMHMVKVSCQSAQKYLLMRDDIGTFFKSRFSNKSEAISRDNDESYIWTICFCKTHSLCIIRLATSL